MKYTIFQDESQKEVMVTRNKNSFGLDIEGTVTDVRVLSKSGSTWIVDVGSGPEKLLVVATGEQTEIIFRNSRHVADVFDTRKLALRMMDFAGGNEVISPMTGRVVSINVGVGQFVEKGDVVVIVEAMKMENPMKATRSGVISEVCVSIGDVVEAKTLLLRLEDA